MKTLKQKSDDELVVLYMNGNTNAMNVLYERHIKHITKVSLLVVNDVFESEDIAQETFIKFISIIAEGRYSRENHLKGYLSCVAHNLSIDFLRTKKRSPFLNAPFDEEKVLRLTYEIRSNELNAEEIDELKALKARLHCAVSHLPVEQQDVITQRYFSDKVKFKEIALNSGVSINTCIARMRYALINLRALLNVPIPQKIAV